MRISASMACCHGHATMRAENAAGCEAEGKEEGDYRVYPAIIKPNGLLFKYCLSFLDLMAPNGAFGDVSTYVKRCQERFVSASFIVPFHILCSDLVILKILS